MAKVKRGINVAAVVLKAVLVLIILAGVASNVLFFKQNSAPSFMGYTAYIMNSEQINGIKLNSLIISKEASLPDIQVGSIVLFKDSSGVYALAGVNEIKETDSGKTYALKNNIAVDGVAAESSIVAKAIRSYPEVGSYIAFTTTQNGIILLIILPLAILILLLILNIRKERKLSDEEFAKEFAKENSKPKTEPKSVPVTQHTETAKKKPRPLEEAPLYEPNKPAPIKPEFVEKKASVAKNFSEKASAQSAAKPTAKPIENTPVADILHTPDKKSDKLPINDDFDETEVNRQIEKRVEEIKLSMHKQTVSESKKNIVHPNHVSEPVPDFTADEILDQLAPKPEKKPESVETVKIVEKPEAPKPQKPAEPVAEPIKKPTVKKNPPRAKLNASSFDDLLKVIDNEKKKLD